jgi:hypothetical protein
MNIEDLIREANPVRPGDVADATSPKAQRMLARILQQDALPGEVNGRAPGAHGPSVYRYRHSRHGPSPRSRKRRLIITGVAAVAAGAAAAGLLLAVPGPTHPQAPTVAPGSKAHSSATPGAPQYTSAQQVLLAAAANVTTGAATSGKFWRLQEVTGVTWPAGTPTHPYDISVSESFDQWNPRSPGVKNWDIFQERGAVPATPADAAAWRAAGSPTSWQSGAMGGFHDGWWNGVLSTSTTHSLRGADWQRGNGIVGYVEGDEKGLTASQFAAVPATQSGVLAFLLEQGLVSLVGGDGPAAGPGLGPGAGGRVQGLGLAARGSVDRHGDRPARPPGIRAAAWVIGRHCRPRYAEPRGDRSQHRLASGH